MPRLNFRLVQNSCRPCENNSHSRNIDRETRAVAHFARYISGHDRSQMFLLPEAVDDYVDADNPAGSR